MKIDTNVMMWYYNVDVFFEDFYTGGLENYRSGPLYLLVQNSNAAIKYIEITSIILRDDGR